MAVLQCLRTSIKRYRWSSLKMMWFLNWVLPVGREDGHLSQKEDRSFQGEEKACVTKLWHAATLLSVNDRMAFMAENKMWGEQMGKLRVWMRPDHEDPCVADKVFTFHCESSELIWRTWNIGEVWPCSWLRRVLPCAMYLPGEGQPVRRFLQWHPEGALRVWTRHGGSKSLLWGQSTGWGTRCGWE